MKTQSKTNQQLLLEMDELRARLDATERRLQVANETLQAQIAECKRAEETLEIPSSKQNPQWFLGKRPMASVPHLANKHISCF